MFHERCLNVGAYSLRDSGLHVVINGLTDLYLECTNHQGEKFLKDFVNNLAESAVTPTSDLFQIYLTSKYVHMCQTISTGTFQI